MNRLDRRHCDICGKTIDTFGYMKLQDGSMCTDCAKFISPFLKNRKDATVDYMKRHIEYRRDNERKLSEFQSAIRYGYENKIYIDSGMYAFLVTTKFEKDIYKGNPDIIPLADVVSCDTEIKEYKNGYYDFITAIKLNNEWFDEVRVKLNKDRIEGEDNRLYHKCKSDAKQLKDTLMPDMSFGASIPDIHSHNIYRL